MVWKKNRHVMVMSALSMKLALCLCKTRLDGAEVDNIRSWLLCFEEQACVSGNFELGARAVFVQYWMGQKQREYHLKESSCMLCMLCSHPVPSSLADFA